MSFFIYDYITFLSQVDAYISSILQHLFILRLIIVDNVRLKITKFYFLILKNNVIPHIIYISLEVQFLMKCISSSRHISEPSDHDLKNYYFYFDRSSMSN